MELQLPFYATVRNGPHGTSIVKTLRQMPISIAAVQSNQLWSMVLEKLLTGVQLNYFLSFYLSDLITHSINNNTNNVLSH